MTSTEYISKKTLDLFEVFSFYKIKSLATRKSYFTELNLFLECIKKDAMSATDKDAETYIEILKKRVINGDLAYETLSKKYKYLNAMFNYWAHEIDNTRLPTDFINPFRAINIQDPTYMYTEADILTFDQINTFFDFVLTSSKRDYLLYQVIYFSLIKPSIVLELTRDHLKKKNDDFYLILAGISGTKARNVKIPSTLGNGLAYLLATHTEHHIFLNSRGNHLTLRAMQKAMKKYSDLFNLDNIGYSPTVLYHAGIFHALKGGMTKEELVYQLGISDTRFLDRYQVAESNQHLDVSGTCDYIKIKTF